MAVGHADLAAMTATQSPELRQRLMETLGNALRISQGDGPIRTLLDAEPFDAVHLLSNYPSWIGKLFGKWIGKTATIHQVELRDPTDYGQIFRVVDGISRQFLVATQSEICAFTSVRVPRQWLQFGCYLEKANFRPPSIKRTAAEHGRPIFRLISS